MKKQIAFLLLLISVQTGFSQNAELDVKVESFLKKNQAKWRDLNVPFEDGKILHDIVVKKGYKSALEIGTSTGHSTIWIAWAMSKTGGKVTTIEIDPSRHKQALKNIEEAGLIKFVDARLGNAHDLVKSIDGPFDFVFSDADKEWYKQYFLDIHPKLLSGGCYTTHNVADGLAGNEYLDFVKSHPDYTTTIDRTSRAGVMISYKK